MLARMLHDIDKFQFALPRGERRSAAWSMRGRCGFNSRSRVGSDDFFVRAESFGAVSIRAPAWGATVIRSPMR